MEVIDTPELSHLQAGGSLKILQIVGRDGMLMPPHQSSE